ncbi:MAG: lamin tail domain-containing protein [Bacteroidia bacterium]|nr:lamin tail domain-containing protein [Bacteroidia bacterium]
MRKLLLLTFSLLAFSGAFAQCSDLFFSEYLEGSSNNKAVEVYNPTNQTIDLTNYVLYRYNNGSPTPTDSLFPQGTLAAKDVFVIGNPSAVAAILNVSDTTHTYTFFNGDDALSIHNRITGDTLDIIGIIGNDPGTNWTVGTGATSEFTLIRKIGIQQGQLDWSISVTEWDVYPQNMLDSLGMHSMTPCPVLPNCSTDLFFSEYLEGSSNNKALEIYNPTNNTVDLNDYVIFRFNNGSPTASDSLFPQGMLDPDSVFVIGNPSAVAGILSESDTLHTATFFNGDDAMVLINRVTTDTLDIIGIVGVDPGTNWPVGTGATSEYTLIRKPTIHQGQTDWSVSVTEWDVYPQNTIDSLGSHHMIPCSNILIPTFYFNNSAINVDEAAGTATVVVNLIDSDTNTTDTIEIVLSGGSATNGSDYTFSSPVQMIFPMGTANASLSINIPITDDMLVEGVETIILDLQNPSGNAVIAGGSMTINIIDNDFYTYPIGTISSVDTSGVVDSSGVKCRIRGVVYGYNLSTTGYQFTLIDPTGGIQIFGSFAVSSYVVAEGDSLAVIGTVGQFNGLAQFAPDSIEFVSSGNTLKTPSVVTQLDESTESDLVQLECFTIVNPASWTGTGPGFNVNVTNGVDTLLMRIDNDVDLYTLPVPTGYLVITGIGGQFDPSSPYLSGYQILPRYSADIVSMPAVSASFTQSTSNGFDYQFTDGSTGATAWEWDFGDGSTSVTQNPLHQYTNFGTYTVTLIASNTCSSDTATFTVDIIDALDESAFATSIIAFPNPASQQVKVKLSAKLAGSGQLILHDLSGKVIRTREIRLQMGEQVLDFGLQGISAGCYLLEISVEGQSYTTRIGVVD